MNNKSKKITQIFAFLVAIFSFFCLPNIKQKNDIFAEGSQEITISAINGTVGNPNESYDKLFDGKKTSGVSSYTKWCVENFGSGAYVVAQASAPICVNGYTFTTGNDCLSYNGRNPKSWKLYGCNDYNQQSNSGTWVELHSVTSCATIRELNYKQYHFAFDNETQYSYYKFEFSEKSGTNDTVMQLGEIEFSYGDVTAIEGSVGNNNVNEEFFNVFDGKKQSSDFTKWCVHETSAYGVFMTQSQVCLTGYSFVTGNDNEAYAGRNPKSWTIYGCNDYDFASKTGTWVAIHSVTNDTTMLDNNFTEYSFEIPNNTTLYKYYKLDITENKGADIVQFCELGLTYSSCIHTWTETGTTDATCTTPQYINKECSKCHTTKKEAVGNPLGHSWSTQSSIPATCTEPKKLNQICSLCGGTQTIDDGEANDHSWSTISTTPATCTSPKILNKECGVCHTTQQFEEGSALGHLLDDSGDCSRCLIRPAQQCGVFLVSGGEINVDYRYVSTTLQILNSTPLYIEQTDSSTAVTNSLIVINSTQGANVTIAGLNLDRSTAGGSPMSVNSDTTGNVVINLAYGTENILKGGEGHAGLEKIGASTLIIDGLGKLKAYGGKYAPGIGSDKNKFCENITFKGGIVYAEGGEWGPGIGSGNFTVFEDVKKATNITIEDGVVDTQGGYYNCGIGGERATIKILGGSVTANGGIYGCAMGGTVNTQEGFPNIIIDGGCVNAVGGGGCDYDFGDDKNTTETIYPKNSAGAIVYKLGVYHNDDLEKMYVDGEQYTPIVYKDYVYTQKRCYMYLTGETHTVQYGNKIYTYSFADGKFSDPTVADVECPDNKGFQITLEGTTLLPSKNYDYTYAGGVLTILSSDSMVITSDGETTDRIFIPNNVTANITLAGVNINVSAEKNACALLIEDGNDKNVTITLKDGTTNILKSGQNCAGIQKNGNTGTLIIQGTGSLTVCGGNGGAGIGGCIGVVASNIKITNGVITAIGGENASGIGSGMWKTSNGITINGGSVKVVAGANAKKIGAGFWGGKEIAPMNLAGEDVYLFTIANADNETIKIDGELYGVKNHILADSTDVNLYVYLSGEDHTVEIGDTEHIYHFNSTQNNFVECKKSSTLVNDSLGHWYECEYSECDKKFDYEEHSFVLENKDSKYVKVAGNCTTTAEYYKSCKCGLHNDDVFYGPIATGHSWDNDCDTDCNVCGETRTITHQYEWKWDTEGKHWQECSVCFDIVNPNPNYHIFYYGCDRDCNICGYIRPESEITHAFVTISWKKDETKHYHECSDCGLKKDEANHTYINNYGYNEDGHYLICDVCGYGDEDTASSHIYVINKNSDKHWYECSTCGRLREEKTAHIYDNDCDTTCNLQECSYVRTVTHSLGSWQNDDTKHWKECADCHTKVLENTHNYQPEFDDDKHWEECSDCGKKINEFSHSYDNDDDLTCNGCDYVRLISVNSVKFRYSGYGLNQKVENFKIILDENTVGLYWEEDADYDTWWFIITDIDEYLSDEYYDAYIADDDHGYFMPNKEYWVGVYIEALEEYTIENLLGDNILLENATSALYYIHYDDGGFEYDIAYFRLPTLAGESEIKQMPKLEFSVTGWRLGATFGDVDFVASDKNIAISDKNIGFEFWKDVYIHLDNDNKIEKDAFYTIFFWIDAPTGYTFYGYTKNDIVVNGSNYLMSFYISPGGGYISCEYYLPAFTDTHTHISSSRDSDDEYHYYICSVCNQVYDKEKHVYDDESDAECNNCGYCRDLYITSLEFTLSGYKIDQKITDIKLESNKDNVGIVWNKNASYGQDFVVFTDIYNYQIVDKADTSCFMPNCEYWLSFIIVADDDYNMDLLTKKDIKITNIGTADVLEWVINEVYVYIKLPQLQGTSKIKQVPNVKFVLDGYSVGAKVKDMDVKLNNANAGVKSFLFEISKASSGEVTADEVFRQEGLYILNIRIVAQDGYTFLGMDESNFEVANLLFIENFRINSGYNEVWLECYLKPLVAEHTHTFGDNYMSDDNYHWKYCNICLEFQNKALHTYDDDSDLTCNVCGRTRTFAITELEFTLNNYTYGKCVKNLELSCSNQNIQMGVYLDKFVLYYDNTFLIGLNSIITNKNIMLEDGDNYYLMVIISAKDNYSISSLNTNNITLKDCGNAILVDIIDSTYCLAYFELPTIEMAHIHGGKWIDEQDSNIFHEGIKGHYECSICGKNFDNENNEMSDISIAKKSLPVGAWIGISLVLMLGVGAGITLPILAKKGLLKRKKK